ncbi:MAG: GNAT family N-acetyltransferase [Ruminococcaceae bacterium]|nr:GNAT family N-acetyltransferase [Oscillospiraceae bacterium]
MCQTGRPETIRISDTLRLRRFDGDYGAFLPGYEDPVVYRNSEGILDDDKKPDLAYIRGMCDYLDSAGEFYYIEHIEDGRFIPIGDVTVKAENPPIAIWYARYRGRGIGTAVMKTVIVRLKALGVTKITGTRVFKWNPESKKMHERLGFIRVGENEQEYLYDLDLTKYE